MSLQGARCCGIQLVAPSHTQPRHSEFSGSCEGLRWVWSGLSAAPADTDRSLGPLGQAVPQWPRHPGTHSPLGMRRGRLFLSLEPFPATSKGSFHLTRMRRPAPPNSRLRYVWLFQPLKEPGLWWGHWPLIKETSLPCQQSLPAASSRRELSPEVTYSFNKQLGCHNILSSVVFLPIQQVQPASAVLCLSFPS